MQHKVEARSCNHCCCGKAMSIAQPACVFVALGIQHSMRMRRIVICGLPSSKILFHIISKKVRLSKKKKVYVIGTITLCYNNIGNSLPSRDTTILVKNMTTNY